MIATAVNELASVVGTRAACVALAISRATHYRRDRAECRRRPYCAATS
jgi:hypothetical protein